MQILKFHLPYLDNKEYQPVHHSFRIPGKLERIVHVEDQNGCITIWAMVHVNKISPNKISPEMTEEQMIIKVATTGEDIPNSYTTKYIGSVMQGGGTFVWHLFLVN
jgi:hypothetical protein